MSMDDLRLDAALFSLLSYQTPEYVEAAWRSAHGHMTCLPPFLTSGIFQTREVHTVDPRVSALLACVETCPTSVRDASTGACMTVLRWQRCHPGKGEETLVFAVRGTSSWRDVVCDAEVVMAPLDIGENRLDGVCVHAGFRRQMAGLWPTVVRAMTQSKDATTDVLFVGHSLGAAVAALCALRAAVIAPVGAVSWVGVGCPRAGNPVWKDAFDAHVHVRSRVINGRDPVPKVPLECRHGYEHVGDLYHIGQVDPDPGVPNVFDVSFHVLSQYIHNLIPLVSADVVTAVASSSLASACPRFTLTGVLHGSAVPSSWFKFSIWYGIGLMLDACSITSWTLTIARDYMCPTSIDHGQQ